METRPPVMLVIVALLSLAATAGASRQRPARALSVFASPVRNVKYDHFDDYLMGLQFANRQHNQVTKEESLPAGHRHRSHTRPTPTLPTDDEDLVGGSGDTTAGTDPTDPTDTDTSPEEQPHHHSPHRPHPQPPHQTSSATDLDILGYFRDVPRQHWSCCMLGKLAGDKGFHCYAGFYASRITMRNVNRAHNKKMHFHGQDRIPHWGENLMATFQRCVARHGDEFHKCCYAATIEKRERERWSRYRPHTSNRSQRVSANP